MGVREKNMLKLGASIYHDLYKGCQLTTKGMKALAAMHPPDCGENVGASTP